MWFAIKQKSLMNHLKYGLLNIFTMQIQHSTYYQSFIYLPTDALVSCLEKTMLKFTLKQL